MMLLVTHEEEFIKNVEETFLKFVAFFGIAYVASLNARALILKNPLITDWSESTISHGDYGDGRSSGFVRAMFFIQ
jgi:hypothetical protein